jgi:non-canonical purine NTP pyrophosphatase (RdgB/HAM1 family)
VQTFTLVTESQAKVEEFSRLLGRKVLHARVDLLEIQSLSPAEVAARKVRDAYEKLGNVPVLVEDTGLSIDAWSGLPGALIKWFLKSVGPAGICEMLKPFSSTRATAETAIAVCDGEVHVFSGRVGGSIAAKPLGERGFGWDSIFIPEGATRTFSQMEPQEKDTYSMRRLALEQLTVHYRSP